VSTIDAFHCVSDGHVRLSIESGGPRPQALGDLHATDAVPRSLLGDGCVREQSQFEERDI
jgi:hypothetical protein